MDPTRDARGSSRAFESKEGSRKLLPPLKRRIRLRSGSLVKTGNPAIKASVYRKEGKTLISMASWAPKREKVELDIDWKALGLDPKKATLWAPKIPRFQSEVVFAADCAIQTNPGKGWLLIVDETPREISALGLLDPNPLKGEGVKH